MTDKDPKKETEENINKAMQDALDSEPDMIHLSKLDLLKWANESADAILEESGEEPHEIDFQFAGRKVFVSGPLRVVPEDGAKPYFISHVIHEYDDNGEIVHVEEGDIIDEGEADIADFFDPDFDGDSDTES